MAVERALISLPSLSFSTSSSPSSSGSNFIFLNPKFSSRSPLNAKPNQLGFVRRRFKCTADYNRDYFNNSNYNQAPSSSEAYPRPAEIQWKKELCNTVHLIGVVGVAVEIKHLPSGKVLAWTRLAVKKSATDTTWINLTFWDELANIAFQHVEKGQQIHVVGRLVSDTVDSDDGKQQTYYKVVVQQLNFIEKSFSSSETSYDRGGTADSVGQERKVVRNSAGISDVTTEQLWQAFFVNPLEWWDNRKTKRNPKAPDFKHKDTGEALWIEGRYNPPWVKSQLSILDTRMGYHNNQDSTRESNLMAGDSFLH